MLCKHGLCHRVVSILSSVCLSVTFEHSVKMNKRIFKIFTVG